MNITDENREWFVYTLHDPRDNEIRYVGWTFNTEKRLRSHIDQGSREKTHKGHWIKLVRSLGMSPAMSVVETGFGDGWQDAEIKWITYHRSIGTRLTNMTDGGDGVVGYVYTDEMREKIGNLARGRKASPETRAKLSERIMSEETRHKLIRANTGRIKSPEEIEKIRRANTGKKHSDETKQKLREIKTGHITSQETREKLRQAHLGRKVSPESRQRMSIARKGKGTPVCRVDDGIVFDSFEIAAKETGIRTSGIWQAIKHGIRCGGYHWAYVNESGVYGMPVDRTRKIKVRRIEDGVTFDSIKEAAIKMGVSMATIRQSLKDGYRGAGFHWERVDG